MRLLPVDDPARATLMALALFDGAPTLELHRRDDGNAEWRDESGDVVLVVQLVAELGQKR